LRGVVGGYQVLLRHSFDGVACRDTSLIRNSTPARATIGP